MLQSSRRITVLTALLLTAGGALAQSTPTTISYDINVADQVTANTCSAGEPVSLNGTVHVQSTVATDSSGVNSFTVTAANNLTITSTASGTAGAECCVPTWCRSTPFRPWVSKVSPLVTNCVMTSSAAEMKPPGSPRRSRIIALAPGSPAFRAATNSVEVAEPNWYTRT